MSAAFIVLMTTLFGLVFWLYLAVGALGILVLAKIILSTVEPDGKLRKLISKFRELKIKKRSNLKNFDHSKRFWSIDSENSIFPSPYSG